MWTRSGCPPSISGFAKTKPKKWKSTCFQPYERRWDWVRLQSRTIKTKARAWMRWSKTKWNIKKVNCQSLSRGCQGSGSGIKIGYAKQWQELESGNFSWDFGFLERPNWFKMTSQQREAHMKVVMKIELSEDRSLSTLILPQASSTQPLLSAGYDQIPNISSFTLQKKWKEARELVGSPGYILPVAGSSCPFAKQVFNSKQPSKSLVVTRRPTKQSTTGYVFECDRICPQYSYLGLCCHTVATAESNKVLKEYLEILEKNTSLPNLHQLSPTVSGRKGAGRKGSKPVRCRARAYEKQPVLDTAFFAHRQ